MTHNSGDELAEMSNDEWLAYTSFMLGLYAAEEIGGKTTRVAIMSDPQTRQYIRDIADGRTTPVQTTADDRLSYPRGKLKVSATNAFVEMFQKTAKLVLSALESH